MAAEHGEIGTLRRVTLAFDVEQKYLDAADDFRGHNQGLTVESVAAWLVKNHDPKDGYIYFTVDVSGSQEASDGR